MVQSPAQKCRSLSRTADRLSGVSLSTSSMLRPFPAHCSKGLLQSMPVCPSSHIVVAVYTASSTLPQVPFVMPLATGLSTGSRLFGTVLSHNSVVATQPHYATSAHPLFKLRRYPSEGDRLVLQVTWAINRSLKQPIIGPTSCQLFRQKERSPCNQKGGVHPQSLPKCTRGAS